MPRVARASLRRHGGMEQHASDPAWRSKPSWYLVATDEVIPGCRQDIQRPAGRGHPRATVVAKAEPVGRGLSGDGRNS